MTEIQSSTDVDWLWQVLRAARDGGDEARAAAAKERMAELQRLAQYGSMTDEELDRRIATLRQSRAIDPVAYAQQADGWSHDSIHVRELNDAMAAAVGEDQHLTELQAERARRRAQ